MDFDEALKIVRALANGTHPDTGEALEASSICRQPQAIKALNRAICALVEAQAREQKRPVNAFRTWTRAEDAQVCDEVRQGKDFREIAKLHNRTVPSIVARLVSWAKSRPRRRGKSSRMKRLKEAMASRSYKGR